jgi:hypothetical protein
MARRKTNKSAKIREAFDKLGADARPRDVIAHLAAGKIKVAPAQVSTIKASLGKKKPGRRSGGDLALQDLLAAKKLIEQLGSVEKAQTAIAALAKLR